MGFIRHFETEGAAPKSEGINLYIPYPDDFGKEKELYSSKDGYVLIVNRRVVACIKDLREALNKLRLM